MPEQRCRGIRAREDCVRRALAKAIRILVSETRDLLEQSRILSADVLQVFLDSRALVARACKVIRKPAARELRHYLGVNASSATDGRHERALQKGAVESKPLGRLIDRRRGSLTRCRELRYEINLVRAVVRLAVTVTDTAVAAREEDA